MGTMQYDTVEELAAALKNYLLNEGRRVGVKVDTSLPVPSVFQNLIRDAAATSADGQCVVLENRSGAIVRPDELGWRKERGRNARPVHP